jgi:BirA family biotin operon repressor/biotin-[acetyl-CoA-carboxylase] ligase
VYVSALLRPDLPLAELAPLPLVIALGVAEGLESFGVAPRLKWPNDVELDGGKIAGVLLESSAESDRAEWVVAGVGVNVRRPERANERASYLSDTADVTLAAVAAAVLDGIGNAYERFCATGFGELIADYERRSSLTGRDVVVRDANGAVRTRGPVAGIDSWGRLLVLDPEGETAISAGDVTLRPDASSAERS